jgi:hypothetical protein
MDLTFVNKDNKTITFDWSPPSECYDKLSVYCLKNGTNISTIASLNESKTRGVCKDLLSGTWYWLLGVNERNSQQAGRLSGPHCTSVSQIETFKIDFFKNSLNATISYKRPDGNYEKVIVCFAEYLQVEKCIDVKNQEIIILSGYGVNYGKEYTFNIKSIGCNHDSISTNPNAAKLKTGISLK